MFGLELFLYHTTRANGYSYKSRWANILGHYYSTNNVNQIGSDFTEKPREEHVTYRSIATGLDKSTSSFTRNLAGYLYVTGIPNELQSIIEILVQDLARVCSADRDFNQINLPHGGRLDRRSFSEHIVRYSQQILHVSDVEIYTLPEFSIDR